MCKDEIKFLISKNKSSSSAVVILYSLGDFKKINPSFSESEISNEFSNSILTSSKEHTLPSIYLYDSISSDDLKSDTIAKFSEKMLSSISKLNLKRVTIIGVLESGSLVSIYLSEKYPKLVRRLILVDPNVRKEPNIITFILDKLEILLPCGLFLRKCPEEAFDLRGIVHRINCPSLILSSSSGSFFSKKSIRFLKNRMPNSWCIEFDSKLLENSNKLNSKLKEILFSFINTPSKRPQKILSEEESKLILEEAEYIRVHDVKK